MERTREKIFEEYTEEILQEGAEKGGLRIAMDRAISAYRENAATALTDYPETLEVAEEVQEIKNDSIDHMDELIEQAMASIHKNHGHVYLAKDAEEANQVIADIVGEPEKIVVKAKSLTTEEIHLREYLEGVGHEVYETDLGEFLIQLRRSRPMHLLAPSIDLSREEAAKLVGDFLGKEIPPEIDKIVKEVRGFMRQKYVDAHVGISGANALAADTGAMFIVENEGNARLSTALPEKHIAVIGVEKIVPKLHDAFKVAEVSWRFGNYRVPSYVNMIAGPSKTGDIEKTITYGAHGPSEFHVVLLDNGRREMAKDPVMKQSLRCLRCGACLYECPVFSVTAGHFGKQYLGGIGIVWDAYAALNEKEASPEAFTCTLCDRCTARCPMKIQVPEMVRELRYRLKVQGLSSPAAHKKVHDVLTKFFGQDSSIVQDFEKKKPH